MAEHIEKTVAKDLVNEIYTQKRIEEPDDLSPYHLGFFEGFYSACGKIMVALENTSAADVRPVVRGEWIDDGCITRCKYCGEEKEFPHWRFYPNCGAEMLGGFSAEEIYETGKWIAKGFKNGLEGSTVSTDGDGGDAE